MDNTKNGLLMAAMASLLLMGTAIIPMQAHAYQDKKIGGDDNDKKSIKASLEKDKRNASQKMDQDNTCYRDEDCQQANQGQQIVGNGNEANGFNDQSRSIQEAPIHTQTTTPPTSQNNTQPLPPTPKTCEQCFTSLLTPAQLNNLKNTFTSNLTKLCLDLQNLNISEIEIAPVFLRLGLDFTTTAHLIECLEASGIVFIKA